MKPTLHFIGTGTPETRGQLNEGGFILQTNYALLWIDPGPGTSQCKLKLRQPDACIVTSHERGHDADLINAKENVTESKKVASVELIKKESGWKIKTPDGTISYITGKIKLIDTKQYAADTIIFFAHGQEEEIITKLKPKLTILTGHTKELLKRGPLYFARELQKKTKVQTIAAQDNTTVDLNTYSGTAEQKGLAKFG
ncbi:hypothetical protein COV18_01340 [Candidatus Woesearchaeota archaeon CG10_big_fil_rev_8_21_14_0_10_37_12]|nr:MAG: hypothetical protein COV18_01340 [Candidatus Woesearchaeota archaeon CG10_big_fil_rev_8_21_14_0_10_37_12]